MKILDAFLPLPVSWHLDRIDERVKAKTLQEAPAMKVIVDNGPDTEREIWAKAQLADLQERYRKEAEPFIKILTEEQSRKSPRHFMMHEPSDRPS